MKFHAVHVNWIFNRNGELMILFGFAIGRVNYLPEAKRLYSFRLFLGLVKFEINWLTGVNKSSELSGSII